MISFKDASVSHACHDVTLHNVCNAHQQVQRALLDMHLSLPRLRRCAKLCAHICRHRPANLWHSSNSSTASLQQQQQQQASPIFPTLLAAFWRALGRCAVDTDELEATVGDLVHFAALEMWARAAAATTATATAAAGASGVNADDSTQSAAVVVDQAVLRQALAQLLPLLRAPAPRVAYAASTHLATLLNGPQIAKPADTTTATEASAVADTAASSSGSTATAPAAASNTAAVQHSETMDVEQQPSQPAAAAAAGLRQQLVDLDAMAAAAVAVAAAADDSGGEDGNEGASDLELALALSLSMHSAQQPAAAAVVDTAAQGGDSSSAAMDVGAASTDTAAASTGRAAASSSAVGKEVIAALLLHVYARFVAASVQLTPRMVCKQPHQQSQRCSTFHVDFAHRCHRTCD
jgi:hypothetical protein